MEISQEKMGDMNVVSFNGRLDAYAANDVERELEPLLADERVHLILNLAELEYISSSGLRVMLIALKKAKKQKGDVRLASLQPYVKEVFDIAGFTQLFKLFDNVEDAVNSFKEE